MINNKNDYISFITTDDTANGFERKKIKSFDVIFRYLRVLRKLEYAINTKHKLLKIYYQNRLYKLSVKIGAHSVVTRDILDGLIVARVPGKHISTLESFKNRMIGDCVPTRKMSQEEKRKYLIDHHPEWF